MQIGKHKIKNNLILAPMAGISDKPFRQICKKMGAGLTISEMVGSISLIRGSKKTIRRANYQDEEESPRCTQIVGSDPKLMAEAAKINVDLGAEIIDINMGCPAKKVCNMNSGSSLLKNEKLVKEILSSVVTSVTIPVTLKIRTGWDEKSKNAIQIAKIAENEGIKALTIHGRTRNCFFKGEAEYETIAQIKQISKIPIIANGDINSAEKAKFVLDKTNADAIMIGRAAKGYPWIFQEINHFLKFNKTLEKPSFKKIYEIILEHLKNIHIFYGEYTGVRMARKHISWYSKGLANGAKFRDRFNKLNTKKEQLLIIDELFSNIIS